MNRALLRRLFVVLAASAVFARIAMSHVPFCPMAGLLGVPCPGCGLTRATMAMLSGHWRAAAHLHPLVFLIAPLMLWAVSSAAMGYVRGPRAARARRQANPWLTSRTASTLAAVLLLATLVVWGVRFFGYLGGPAPVQTFSAWASAQHSQRGLH